MDNFCHHVGIFTSNLPKLIRFYTEKLGFVTGETKSVPEDLVRKVWGISSPCTLTKLKFGQVILEILSPENLILKKRPFNVRGYNHWSLGVENKKDFCQELEKRGVSLLKFEKNGHFIFFVRDPDGNPIEIYES